MQIDVTSLGELLIDLVPVRLEAGLAYVPKPGGAPANVAAGIARLGRSAAMIGKVGGESFGRAAVSALRAAGVATDSITLSAIHNTPLAVVSLGDRGESDFVFYREGCADSNLVPADIPDELIAQSAILHVGTLLLSAPGSAEAQHHAVAVARSHGVRVSIDVNFRQAFWRDRDRMRAAGLEAIRTASIVKASADELSLLTGSAATETAVRSLWQPDLLAFAVTKGGAGAELYTKRDAVSVAGFAVPVVDTVGCGDAFMAGLLSGLLDFGFDADAKALATIARRANAAGAILATRSGALESMPTREEVDQFVAASPSEFCGK